MTVTDVFFIRGRGVVATGRIEDGTLRVGDEVRVDGGPPVRVDGIEAFRKVLEEAQAGANVGVLFASLEAQRAQYLSMREAGLMTDAEIDEALRALTFAHDGRNWFLTVASDGWRSAQP